MEGLLQEKERTQAAKFEHEGKKIIVLNFYIRETLQSYLQSVNH